MSNMEHDVPVLEARRRKDNPQRPDGKSKFRHSGDMGDILFALPAMRAMGGGSLYLDVEGGKNSETVKAMLSTIGRERLKFNYGMYEFLRPLLLQQSCVNDVQTWDEGMDTSDVFDLDSFRTVLSKDSGINLAQAHLRLFGMTDDKHCLPWLQVDGENEECKGKILVARNLRYQNSYLHWEENREFLSKNGIFCGLDIEYDAFKHTLDIDLPRVICKDALDICRCVKSAREVWANQGLCMTMAIGMGATFVQEVFKPAPNTRFLRENGYYV